MSGQDLSLGAGLALDSCAAGAAAGFAYLRWKDKHQPEPWVLHLLSLTGGSVAVLGVLRLQRERTENVHKSEICGSRQSMVD